MINYFFGCLILFTLCLVSIYSTASRIDEVIKDAKEETKERQEAEVNNDK